jgi:hypothetical protein
MRGSVLWRFLLTREGFGRDVALFKAELRR